MTSRTLALTLLISTLAISTLSAQPPNRSVITLVDHSVADFKEAVKTLQSTENIILLNREYPVIRFGYDSESQRQVAMAVLAESGYRAVYKNGMPADFPMLPPRATAEQIAVYQQQKETWVNQYPDRYAAMQNRMHEPRHLSRSEFEVLPPEKQQHIKSNPDLYSIGE